MVAKKVILPEYEPLDDVLSAETAFLQASCALDIAAVLAVEYKDIKTLRAVAQQYIELGSHLMNPGPMGDEEEDVDDLTDRPALGFSVVEHEHEREAAHGGTTGKESRDKAYRIRGTRLYKQHEGL